MNNAQRIFFVAVVLAVAFQASAAQPSASALAGVPRFTREQWWVAAPDPKYPVEALQRHISGRGVFQLKIHPQRRTVTRVTILKSTGSKILDDTTVRVLSQWRLRRGQPMDRIDHVDVPVAFIL
jgi:TonB family protein